MKFSRRLASLLLSSVALTSLSLTAQAAVIPFGVQTDVAATTVQSWGWSSCYSEYAEFGGSDTQVSGIASNCDSDYTMMGLYSNSQDKYEVIAAGETATVFNNTPGIYAQQVVDGANKSNGVNWYLYDNPNSVYGAWGFFSEGVVQPWHCDYSDQGNVNKNSLCMHMRDSNGVGDGNPLDDYISDTYAYFDTGTLNYVQGSDFEIHFFTTTGAPVPAPGAFFLFAIGLIGLGVNRNRK